MFGSRNVFIHSVLIAKVRRVRNYRILNIRDCYIVIINYIAYTYIGSSFEVIHSICIFMSQSLSAVADLNGTF